MRTAIIILFISFSLFSYAQPETKLTASNAAASDALGFSVAISGDYAVSGAYLADVNGYTNSGTAYFYKLNNGTWEETQIVVASDTSADDQFGYSVTMDGEWAVIGANFYGPTITSTQGKVYIFRRDANDVWNEFTSFQRDNYNSTFGTSVALDGSYLVVGSPTATVDLDNDGIIDTKCGAAQVYHFDGTSWVLEDEVFPSDGAADDEFGNSVAIDNGKIAIGAWKADNGGDNQGSAYVYYQSGTSWLYEATFRGNDSADSDYFGSSVAINENNTVIGAYRNLSSQGAAYFYTYSSSWTFTEKKQGFDGDVNDQYGCSIQFIDANNIIIGALKHKTDSQSRGAAYLYEYDSNNQKWINNSLDSQIIASDGASYDYYGTGVAGDGTNVLIGAYKDDDVASGSGSNYFYDLSSIIPQPLPVEITDFRAIAENQNVHLLWNTATEKNNEGFEIQSSTDGIQWNTIGWMDGAGNSQTEQRYDYWDFAPNPGINYYRLIQIDYDGQSEKSDIVSAIISEKFDFAAYPNPTKDIVNLDYHLEHLEVQKITVYDLLGRIQMHVPTDSKQIDLTSLPKGTYLIQMLVSGQSRNKLITKE